MSTPTVTVLALLISKELSQFYRTMAINYQLLSHLNSVLSLSIILDTLCIPIYAVLHIQYLQFYMYSHPDTS